MREGLHLGVVVDEHRLDFERGDFLVRNLLGADQPTGALAVGEPVDVGQTVQFQVRDAAAADEDLRRAARRASTATRRAAVHLQRPRARTCSPSRTTTPRSSRSCSAPVPLAGAFCAGEIGPIGGRNFLHGFTASVAVFG